VQSNHGVGDFPKVVLTAPDGAQAELYLYGAHVTAWRPMADARRPAGGAERLFLSERSEFRAGAAIRGGVPVCFPQFAGEGPLLPHGFARLQMWTLVRAGAVGASAQAMLQLEDSEATRVLWPHAFRATLTVTVGGPSLRLEFAVQNTGATPFTFTGALHTYLHVNDIATTVVENLSGVHYRDKVTGARDEVQAEPEIHFPGQVDRVYCQAPAQVVVREPERRMTVQAAGFPDVVVWNPGPERCAALADMEPAGYHHMVCVEAAVVSAPPEVPAGSTWRGAQELMAQ
jgi:glucose-6-phosphate 1-epimerase